MGFRFEKRIRLFKDLALNLSKSGASLTVGGKGASVNVRGDKVTGNAGIPRTGMSYRRRQTARRGVGAIFRAVLGFIFGR
jgi:hypothetical protein